MVYRLYCKCSLLVRSFLHIYNESEEIKVKENFKKILENYDDSVAFKGRKVIDCYQQSSNNNKLNRPSIYYFAETIHPFRFIYTIMPESIVEDKSEKIVFKLRSCKNRWWGNVFCQSILKHGIFLNLQFTIIFCTCFKYTKHFFFFCSWRRNNQKGWENIKFLHI